MKRILTIILVITLIFSGCNIIGKNENEELSEFTNAEITLYFGDSQAMYVVPEKRTISFEKNLSKEQFIDLVLQELVKGPQNENLYPTIPNETKILNIEIEKDTLYVDFSKEMHTTHWGGAAGENMTLLSLANTTTEIEGISKVLPSVEGNALNIEHVVVTEPLLRDEDGIGKQE
ncbi:MAG: GerMN domain-containing protein [Clostridiales bacterium]|nr:GerMN domain-containing protein [Clostridiales bacterium]